MKRKLIAGTINYYPAEDGWRNYHLDITNRVIWDRELNMGIQPEFLGDVANLVDFRDETFDAVQLWHVLEHLAWEDGILALHELHRVLKPYGQLDIEVPDMDRIVEAWVSGEHSKPDLQQWIYGEDLGDGADYHRYGWDAQTLHDELVTAGFRIIEVPETGLAVRYVCEKVRVNNG